MRPYYPRPIPKPRHLIPSQRRSSICPRRDRGRGLNGSRDRLETETSRSRPDPDVYQLSTFVQPASILLFNGRVAGLAMTARKSCRGGRSVNTEPCVVAQLTKMCRPVVCCPVRLSPSCLSPSWFVGPDDRTPCI